MKSLNPTALKEEVLKYAKKYGENANEQLYIYRLARVLITDGVLNHIKSIEHVNESVPFEVFMNEAFQSYLIKTDFMMEDYSEENNTQFIPMHFGDSKSEWTMKMNEYGKVSAVLILNDEQYRLLDEAKLISKLSEMLFENRVCHDFKVLKENNIEVYSHSA